MKSLFFNILFFVFLISCERTPHEVLPSDDRRALEDFFELLVKDHNFAYTLFGTKPISIADYRGEDPTSFDTLILERGWASWCRYKHLFQSRHFELIQADLGRQNDRHYKEIVIINKQATVNVIRKNIKIFQDFLKNEWSPESIMKAITEDNEFYKNIVRRSDLFGILLGYGYINSLNFEKSKNLSLHISEETNPPLQENFEGLNDLGLIFVKGYGKSKLKPNSRLSLDLSTSKEELNKIVESVKPFELDKNDFLLDCIRSVVFSGVINDEETKSLKQNYSETRSKIIEAYDGKPMFEVTMNQWIKK